MDAHHAKARACGASWHTLQAGTPAASSGGRGGMFPSYFRPVFPFPPRLALYGSVLSFPLSPLVQLLQLPRAGAGAFLPLPLVDQPLDSVVPVGLDGFQVGAV